MAAEQSYNPEIKFYKDICGRAPSKVTEDHRSTIKKVMRSLSKIEGQVMAARYGFEDRRENSQEEVAAKTGYSINLVKKAEQKGREELKKESRLRALEDSI